jgi:hypothetical protein
MAAFIKSGSSLTPNDSIGSAVNASLMIGVIFVLLIIS